MKIRSSTIRILAIAIILGALALLASPNDRVWDLLGLLTLWVLGDLPEAHAWRALTADERAAAGTEPASQAAVRYALLALPVGIGIFTARVRRNTGESAYLVSIAIPVLAFAVATSILTWRRLRLVQLASTYRRAFLLSCVLQLIVLGAALGLAAQQ